MANQTLCSSASLRSSAEGETMVRVFYSSQYVGSAYAFETTRKAKWVAASLTSPPMPAVELVSSASLSCEQLLQVHAPAYVEAVQTGLPRDLAESQGFEWDAGLWPMVLASNGGAVAAALRGLPGITSEILIARERLVFDWCRERELAIAFVLAGGYTGDRLTEKGLVNLHRLTLSAATARN